MKNSQIEWTDKVWNPSIGCNKVSPGCKFCYAEVFARRLKAMGLADYERGFAFRTLPNRIEQPLRIKKPTKFFVNSMSDLFHEKMPASFLDKILGVIERTPQHIYQILTKRPEKMAEYFHGRHVPTNVWLGVSVESESYKHRIDFLREIKASIRFISFEPLIGAVGDLDLQGIQWAIVGGESGRNARPVKQEWIEEIFFQCKDQAVAFFFKQWGTWGADEVKRNKKENGRLFKGSEWSEYPAITTPQSHLSQVAQ